MVCLANSWKPDGRCVAAKEIVGRYPGSWIRPVSALESGGLSQSDRCYTGNKEPEVGDVFYAHLLRPQPHAYQVENELIDDSKFWKFERKATYAQLVSCLDELSGDIWINGHSSGNGLNDRIPIGLAPSLGETLKFIRLPELTARVRHEEWNGKVRKRYRGCFYLNGKHYILSITDPLFQSRFAALKDGDYNVADVLVCISLGERLGEYAYKVIASVIEKGI